MSKPIHPKHTPTPPKVRDMYGISPYSLSSSGVTTQRWADSLRSSPYRSSPTATASEARSVDVDALLAEIARLNRRIEGLIIQLASEQECRADLEETVKALRMELIRLSSYFDSLKASAYQNKTTASQYEAEAQSLRSRLHRAEVAADDVKDRLQDSETTIANLQNVRNKLQDDVMKAEGEMILQNAAVEEYKKVIADYNSNFTDDRDLAQARTDATVAQVDAAALASSLKTCRQDTSKLQHRLTAAEDDVQRYSNDLNRANKRLLESNDYSAAVEKGMNENETKVRELSTDMESSKAENLYWREQAEVKEREASALQNERRLLKMKISALKKRPGWKQDDADDVPIDTLDDEFEKVSMKDSRPHSVDLKLQYESSCPTTTDDKIFIVDELSNPTASAVNAGPSEVAQLQNQVAELTKELEAATAREPKDGAKFSEFMKSELDDIFNNVFGQVDHMQSDLKHQLDDFSDALTPSLNESKDSKSRVYPPRVTPSPSVKTPATLPKTEPTFVLSPLWPEPPPKHGLMNPPPRSSLASSKSTMPESPLRVLPSTAEPPLSAGLMDVLARAEAREKKWLLHR